MSLTLWFLRRVLLIWLVLFSFCAAGLLIGRLDQTPNELQALGFDLCDGKPCLMGITPGVTTWDDAKTIFMRNKAERALESNYEQLNFPTRAGFRAFVVTRPPDKDLADNVGVYAPGGNSPILSVGDLIRRYGSPRCVASPMQDWAELSYSSMIVVAYRGRSDRLTLNTPIYQITLVNPALKATSLSCGSYTANSDQTTSDWHGFTSWDYYTAHGLARR